MGWQLFVMGLVMLVSIILIRFIERWLVKKLRQTGYNTRYVTLVGSDKELFHLYKKLTSNSKYGYKVRGIYGEIEGLSNNGSIIDFQNLLSQQKDIKLGDEVYLCVPRNQRELIEKTARLCDNHMAKFYYLPIAEEKLNLQPILIDDIGVMTTYASPLEEPLNRLLKRTSDIILSILCLMLTAILFPLIAFIIKRQSPGPVIYGRWRDV